MKGDRPQGRRLADGYADAPDFNWPSTQPGDYWPEEHGAWSVIAPSGEHGVVREPIWKFTVEQDGTLTVSPSIWFNKPTGWHGYLEKGVWREV